MALRWFSIQGGVVLWLIYHQPLRLETPNRACNLPGAQSISSLRLLLPSPSFPLYDCSGGVEYVNCVALLPGSPKACGLSLLFPAHSCPMTDHSLLQLRPTSLWPLKFGSLIVAPLGNLKSGFCLFIVSDHMPLLPSCGKEGRWWTCPLLPLIFLTTHAKHTHSCSHSHTLTLTHMFTHTYTQI